MKEQMVFAAIIIVTAFGLALDSWFEDRRNRKIEQEAKAKEALEREEKKHSSLQEKGKVRFLRKD